MLNKSLVSMLVTLSVIILGFNPNVNAQQSVQNQETSTEVGGCRIIVSGVSVIEVQRKVGVSIDGNLGPATCNAIKVYQCTKNLNVDGIVGPQTWAIMNNRQSPFPCYFGIFLRGLNFPALVLSQPFPKMLCLILFRHTRL